MTREFTLEGLACANCAAKIERAAGELNGVTEASVNLLTATLRVKASGELPPGISKAVERVVHKYEPDVRVVEKKANPGGEARAQSLTLARLICGAVLLAAGVSLEHFTGLSSPASLLLFIPCYLLLGGDVLWKAARNIARGQVFDENFLMCVATLGAFAVGQPAEAAGVMLFYQIGELFQDAAVQKSKKSISALMDIRPDYANLLKDGTAAKVAPETVAVGDSILVKPGERVPLDGVVTAGEALLDTAALTGESVPRRAAPSDEVLSGGVNLNGVLTVEVTKTYGESTVSKIIDLVENAASKKAPTESFITKFARWYTPAVVVFAALIALVPPLFTGGAWQQWLNRGLIFLVISCPCALVISIPLGFFGGIGGASRRGILIKGGNYLEALNKLDMAVFDKTGTLTAGVFDVTRIVPAEGFSREELLEAAARAEAYSGHPIARSVLREYNKPVDKSGLADYVEDAGHGVSVRADGKRLLAGNLALMAKSGVDTGLTADEGTVVHVASDGAYMGRLVISDVVRPDSERAIAGLKAHGVRKTVMLTGDNAKTARAVAGALNLDGVYAGLLPHQKVEKLEELNGQKRAGGKLAFVGDGINDAPVLAAADVGVAMGGLGSDAAIEAADVILMTDEPSKLVEAVKIARFTKRIVWQNIVFSLGVKAVFLLLGAAGMATMWEAVFADVGVALLAILNSMRVMRMPSRLPPQSGMSGRRTGRVSARERYAA